MFTMDLRNVLQCILELSHPNGFKRLGNNVSEGMIIQAKIRLEAAIEDLHFSEWGTFTFVFANRVSVWAHYSNQKWLPHNEVPKADFVNTSNHDSCWRTDGLKIVSDVYFQLAEKINQRLVANGFHGIAPKEMMNHSSIFKSFAENCTVIFKNDGDYKKKLLEF